jgi:hypothetical protein
VERTRARMRAAGIDHTHTPAEPARIRAGGPALIKGGRDRRQVRPTYLALGGDCTQNESLPIARGDSVGRRDHGAARRRPPG